MSKSIRAPPISVVCAGSVLLWSAGALVLSRFSGDPDAEELAQSWDPRIHAGFRVASAVQLVLHISGSIACNRLERLRLAALPALITLFPLLGSVLYHYNLTPLFLSSGNRVLWPGRYLNWATTTSLLMYLSWLGSDTPMSNFWRVFTADMGMLLTGLLASVSKNYALWMVLGAVSTLFEVQVLCFKHRIFSKMLESCRHLPHTHSAVWNIYMLTMVSWTAFPVIWAISEAGLVSHSVEELLWCLCDFGAKMCQSTALSQGILCSVEDRKAALLEETRDMMLKEQAARKKKEESGEIHIANVSHELRTPLNSIISLADALVSDPECRQDDDEVSHSLQIIRDSGARLNMLVNNLLDKATLHQRQLKMTFEPVRISQCIRDVVSLLSPLLSSNVDLVVDLPPRLPAVRGNYDRLVQVFFNLMGNSVKFCRSGEIRVRAHASDGWLVSEIIDTGLGMSQDKLDRVFNCEGPEGSEGEDADESTNGLGLSLVRALVDSHGGSISATSKPGVKTVVTLRLPTYKSKSGQERASIDVRQSVSDTSDGEAAGEMLQPQRFQPRRLAQDLEGYVSQHPTKTEILSVDDDNINHYVLGNILLPQNFALITATGGRQALSLLKRRHAEGGEAALPPVVLMDAMMPEMDGFETARRIRSTFPRARLSIIMVSAKTQEDTIQACFEAGCNDFVAKPIKRTDLISRIERELRIMRNMRPGNNVVLSRRLSGSIGQTFRQLEQCVVVAVRTLRSGGPSQLGQAGDSKPVLDSLFSLMEKLRIEHSLSPVCWSGNFYIVIADSSDILKGWAEQVKSSLEFACELLDKAAALLPRDEMVVRLAVTVHSSAMLCNVVSSEFAPEVVTGEAIQEALECEGVPGCVCISQSVRDALTASPCGFEAVALPGVSGSACCWLLKTGDWTSALRSDQCDAGEGVPPAEARPADLAADDGDMKRFFHLLQRLGSWGPEDLEAFLADMGLGEYRGTLLANGVDLKSLTYMQEDDLEKMGIGKMVHRKTIMAAANYWAFSLSL